MSKADPDGQCVAMLKEKGVLKVVVFADGRLAVNGKVSWIGGLLKSAYTLRRSTGTIWYYREPTREAKPIASDVLLILSLFGPPIQVASKPDYSDLGRTEPPLTKPAGA